VITEAANAGTDLVISSVDFSLAALANVENLTLTGTAVTGTGNAADNSIKGNASANTLSGGDGDDVLDGGAANDSMTGGKGDDAYFVDNVNDKIFESLNEGTDSVLSTIDFSLATLTYVENLILTGSAVTGTGNSSNNTIVGNTANNTLVGNDGDDKLDGGSGADSMNGGNGNDTYVVDNASDTITEASGALTGTDTVYASVNFSLASFGNVENLTLTGTATTATGNAANNVITGNGVANTLSGGDGDDVLNGGLLNDAMTGGLGNDTFFVDHAGDTVVEAAGTGTGTADLIKSSISLSLASFANVENLTLIGGGDINATGDGSANALTGNSGDNVLDGGGGSDTLAGGYGNDTYVVDAAGDTIVEDVGAGIDVVKAGVNWTLGGEVENLILTGTVATGTGNALGNAIIGNASANTISGNDGDDVLDGGAGADALTGGQGADTFILFRGGAADTIDATDTDGGTDTLLANSGIADDQLWFRRVGNDLEISIIGTNDKSTVQGWYTAANKQLDYVELANGEYAATADIEQLTAAMAAFSPPPLGQTTLDAGVKQSLLPTLAASWHSAA